MFGTNVLLAGLAHLAPPHREPPPRGYFKGRGICIGCFPKIQSSVECKRKTPYEDGG